MSCQHQPPGDRLELATGAAPWSKRHGDPQVTQSSYMVCSNKTASSAYDIAGVVIQGASPCHDTFCEADFSQDAARAASSWGLSPADLERVKSYMIGQPVNTQYLSDDELVGDGYKSWKQYLVYISFRAW